MWRKPLTLKEQGYKDFQTNNIPHHPNDKEYMDGWTQALYDEQDLISEQEDEPIRDDYDDYDDDL